MVWTTATKKAIRETAGTSPTKVKGERTNVIPWLQAYVYVHVQLMHMYSEICTGGDHELLRNNAVTNTRARCDDLKKIQNKLALWLSFHSRISEFLVLLSFSE